MKNFNRLLFWESVFIALSVATWGLAPTQTGGDDMATSIAAAISIFIAAFVAIAAITAATITIAAITAVGTTATAVIAGAIAISIAATSTVVIVATITYAAPKLRLRYLPTTISVAVEFAAIFLLLNYGWPLAAVAGVLILFGMRYLPERLVVRPVSAVADN